MSTTQEFFTAQVLSSTVLSPVMRRLVLGGEGLAGFVSSGYADEWFRLLVPDDPSPTTRWYSVRRFDPDLAELTVDIVLHDRGRATEWAEAVRPGESVTISAPAGRYAPPAQAEWELVVADQTGLPAASRILEEQPAGRRVWAILEAPNEAGVLPTPTQADATIRWIFNPQPDVIPSPLAVAVRSFDLPASPGYVWMAGESGCARDVRRYLRHELRWPSTSYAVVGYWRPQAEAYLRRYTQVEDQVSEIYQRGEAAGRDREDTLDEVFAVMESHGL